MARSPKTKEKTASGPAEVAHAAATNETTPRGPRPGSKLAKVVEMLEGDAGATIADIMMATDWQQHTVRGALAGSITKKLGRKLSSDKVEGRGRVYRIAKDSI